MQDLSSEISTEKTLKQDSNHQSNTNSANNSRSAINLLTVFNTRQSNVSTQNCQEELKLVKSPLQLDQVNYSSYNKYTRKFNSNSFTKPKSAAKRTSLKTKKSNLTFQKENVVKSFDAGVPLKPQQATNYNLKASILKTNKQQQSEESQIILESQGKDESTNKPASFNQNQSARIASGRSIMSFSQSQQKSQTRNPKTNGSRRQTSKVSTKNQPHKTLAKSSMLLQLAKETTSDQIAIAQDALVSLRTSNADKRSSASLLSYVSKSPRPSNSYLRQPGAFPVSFNNGNMTQRFSNEPTTPSNFNKPSTASSKSPFGRTRKSITRYQDRSAKLVIEMSRSPSKNGRSRQLTKNNNDQTASNQAQNLPLTDVIQLQNETRLATQERDFLLNQNSTQKANFKSIQQELVSLKQGNAAVSKEISRMEVENSTLVQSHLSAKSVLHNLCNENDLDCTLIGQFTSSNQQIKERLSIENAKISEARSLVKMLKQELLVALKERDLARNSVQIQRKQLNKHSSNLDQHKRDRKSAMRGINNEMSQVVVQKANAFAIMSPGQKDRPNQPRDGMINAFRSLNSSASQYITTKQHRSVNSSKQQAQGRLTNRKGSHKATLKVNSPSHFAQVDFQKQGGEQMVSSLVEETTFISEIKTKGDVCTNNRGVPQWTTVDDEYQTAVAEEVIEENNMLDHGRPQKQLVTFDHTKSNKKDYKVV